MSKNTKSLWDIMIIGAGASGMMAAISAARAGKQVLILEQLDKPGKKILATGNGKCNFTNEYMNSECFYGDKIFSENVLKSFSTEECLRFFHSIGIYPKVRNGYYYPNSEQASSVVCAMTEELKRLAVDVRYRTEVKEILPQKTGFCLKTSLGEFLGKKVIIATGLLAAPKLGSSGSLFSAIKDLGHHFAPIVPALCGFYCNGIPFKKMAGVRAAGKVSALIDKKKVVSDTGEVQFTDYGLSGIPVFQISRHLSLGLYNKQNVEIMLELLPELDMDALISELNIRKNRKCTLELLFNGLLNKKLSDALWEMLQLNPQITANKLTEKDILRIAHTVKNICVSVTKYRDYEFAQVCAGGITAKEVDASTFESLLVPNLYFAGEILNVDGICGGYNLHFAWGSGKIAAESACK